MANGDKESDPKRVRRTDAQDHKVLLREQPTDVKAAHLQSAESIIKSTENSLVGAIVSSPVGSKPLESESEKENRLLKQAEQILADAKKRPRDRKGSG